MTDFDDLKWFDRREFEQPDRMDRVLLMMLDRARQLAGVPFVITSSFREDDPGSHGYGYAVDISCRDPWVRGKIVNGLLLAGFNRLGIYRWHVHVDIDPSRPANVCWYGRYHPETLEENDGVQKEDESETE